MKRYLEISKVTKSFQTPRGIWTAVKDFHLNVAEGEFIALIGHSGCGKSTVLAMIAGLIEPTEGGVIVAGREISGPGPDRGMVFQNASLLPWMTALENVRLGVEQVAPNRTRKEQEDQAAHYLALVGLGRSLNKRPGELSAGMKQRVGIARAFALSPRVLLLDEPFGMLDSLTRIELQDVLLKLWQQNRTTAVLVTHDVDEAVLLSDRVVMMTDGPESCVGEILEVGIPRPRDRQVVMEQPEYLEMRERILTFLEQHSKRKVPPVAAAS